MIHTILFDIGTVLVDFRWQEYLCRMVDDPDERKVIDDVMFKSGLWDEVDRGVWTEQQVLDAFFARVPQYREDIQRIYDNIGSSLIKNAYADAWINEMKARGLRVLFLSNYARYIIAKVPESFTFLEKMDGGVFPATCICSNRIRRFIRPAWSNISWPQKTVCLLTTERTIARRRRSLGFTQYIFRHMSRRTQTRSVCSSKHNKKAEHGVSRALPDLFVEEINPHHWPCRK